jgi:excinuclease ABC subunit B
MDETGRRRQTQLAFNQEHGITPRSVSKSVDQVRFITRVADARVEKEKKAKVAEATPSYAAMDRDVLAKMLEDQMKDAAANMDFELAATLRDQLFELKVGK